MNNIFEELRAAAEKACRLSHEIGRLSQLHLECTTNDNSVISADKVKERKDKLEEELFKLKQFLGIK